MSDRERTAHLREIITEAVQDALTEMGEEVLLSRWVFVGDMIVDDNRTMVTLWDDSMHPMDAEAILAPATRMAKNLADAHTDFWLITNVDTITSMADDPAVEDDEEDWDE